MVPAVGLSNPIRPFSKVDFPTPFRPSMIRESLAWTSKLIPEMIRLDL